MSKTRVHWVSPLPPAETDIGHYTARILPELAAEVDLTLWTDAPDWDPSLEQHCPVRQFDPYGALPRDFAGAGQGPTQGDVLFLNIGNSWVYHRGILELARRIPSIIVLHDLAIQEMLFDSIRAAGLDPQFYLSGMARWYGAEGRKLAENLLAERINARKVLQTAPGFELTMDRAISVLTHTEAAYDVVTARAALPAYLLDLPFAPSVETPSAQRAPDGPLRLLQFGYIGPNRRLEEVLKALGQVAAEIDFRFDVMGKVWDPARIQALVNDLGLTDRVTLHGFVAEPVLDACLRGAHLVMNLRYPTMGEASGSQLRIWNAAATAVVSDLGWYQTLPDDTVFKIPHAGEQAALIDMLRRVHADRSLGQTIAAQGRARLEARHTPARYAKAIATLARHAQVDAATALLARRARGLLQGVEDQNLYRQRLARHLG